MKTLFRKLRSVVCLVRGHRDLKVIHVTGFYAECDRCDRRRLLSEEEMFHTRRVAEISERMKAAIAREFEEAGDDTEVKFVAKEVSWDEARRQGWI